MRENYGVEWAQCSTREASWITIRNTLAMRPPRCSPERNHLKHCSFLTRQAMTPPRVLNSAARPQVPVERVARTGIVVVSIGYDRGSGASYTISASCVEMFR
jgi:hypothetical protein